MNALFGNEFERLIKKWERGSFPSRDREYVLTIVRQLLDAADGIKWLEKHPILLRDEEQIFHGASFRTEELKRYYSVQLMEYHGMTVYLRPEEVRDLRQEVTVQEAENIIFRGTRS